MLREVQVYSNVFFNQDGATHLQQYHKRFYTPAWLYRVQIKDNNLKCGSSDFKYKNVNTNLYQHFYFYHGVG